MADQPATVIAPEDESPTFAGRMAAGLALFVLLGATLIQIYRVGAPDETRAKSFAYTQDAAYQHLVIGRELARGTTTSGPQHFRQTTPLAASASPGWSIAMAVLLGMPSVSGQGRNLDQIALVPLGVNIVAAALLIAVAGHLVSREVRSGLGMFAFLVGLGVLVALPLMAMTGMEHLAHMVIVLLSVAVGLRSVDRPEASVTLILLAAVLIAISVSLRFESLAVMLALLLWAWIQRRMGRKLPSVLAGIGIVVAVGAYLARHGASVAPDPVLVHGGMLFGGHWSAWAKMLFERAVLNLHTATLPWVLVLMGAVLLAACRGWTHSSDPLGRRNVGWLFVFVFAGLAHVLVGQADEQSMRYTAYLIPLGAVAIARGMGLIARTGWLVAAVPSAIGSGASERAALLPPVARPWVRGNGLIAIVCLLPVVLASVLAIRGFVNAPQAARDAYIRERLAASFVRTFWSEGPVATNETGALGYETRAALVDLSGWTDHVIAKARFDGTYDRELIAREVAQSGAQLALLLGEARDVPIPQSWKAIGGWHQQGEDRASDSSVRVFSVRPGLDSDVRMALHSFGEQQHSGVEFWFADDGSTPSPTRPASVQLSESGEPPNVRAS